MGKQRSKLRCIALLGIFLYVGTWVGFSVGFSLGKKVEREKEWKYPESQLESVWDIAEKLHSARWTCEKESCLQDFTELSRLLHIYAKEMNIDVNVLRGILMVENPWFDVEARSYAGAVGLMQVMPFHVFKECEEKGGLASLEGNLCAGTRVLSQYLDEGLEYALLRYNGCTTTGDCTRYPGRVLKFTNTD